MALGHLFQHSAEVITGCHALKMGKGVFLSSPAPGKTDPAWTQETKIQGKTPPDLATGAPPPAPLPTTVFSLEARSKGGFHQGHRRSRGGLPADVARLLLLGVPRPFYLQRSHTLSTRAHAVWSGLRCWAA